MRKGVLSLIVSLMMIAGVLGTCQAAFALNPESGGEIAFTAERTETSILVKMITPQKVNFGGFELIQRYSDVDEHTYFSEYIQTDGWGFTFNNPKYQHPEYGEVIFWNAGNNSSIGAGDTAATMKYDFKENMSFEPDTEYVFNYYFKDAWDKNLKDLACIHQWFSAVYAEYTVKFEAPDADAPVDATQYVVRGQSATAPDDPQRTGFEFDGWEVSKGNAASVTDAIMEPTTFTAKWKKATARTATVTWVDGNGKTLKTDTVEHGVTPVYDGDTPTKTDPENQYTYRFNGNWDPAVAPVSGDVTYTAQFDQVQTGYHIYVKDYTNGGAVTSLDPNAYYSGTVDFTVDAGQATVLAQVVDGTAETVNSTDGTYERLYGTETDGSHRFSVTMPGDRDLYLIMGYKGDCDCNGGVDLKDATNISQIYVETQTANALQRLLGDADGNGELTLKDSTRIAWHYTDREPLKWDQRES